MKIFGTGLQRTGTTSLGNSLLLLGFRTVDFPAALFADIDHDLIRDYDAFTDNPIPLLYQQLDERYPDSKFIHTERGEEAWLTSVEWLYTIGQIKFGWDERPDVAAIHEKIYGTSEFDREIFLARYRRHNAEVREYFGDRPDDLLIFDVTAGDGFEKLCPFLGVAQPNKNFPHRNKSESVLKVRLRKALKRLLP
jgi:hypothetical protein